MAETVLFRHYIHQLTNMIFDFEKELEDLDFTTHVCSLTLAVTVVSFSIIYQILSYNQLTVVL